ncbi:MAG: trimethylamine methyltransferase family protein [Candidatus Latescibacterota bacterium]
MKLSTLTVLSDSEIQAIHTASLDILENCGVKILSPRMLTFLSEQGLDVHRDTQTVRFSRTSVEEALGHMPSQFDVFDREGAFAFTLGDGNSKIAAGHNAVFWVDTDTGQTRNSTVADVALFSRICQELDAIDMIGIPVMPQDVPNPKATLLYGLAAVIENSTKPVFFSTESAAVTRSCAAMLQAAFAGDLKTQAYGIGQLSPTSPLFWEQGAIDAIMDLSGTGVPIAVLPEPNAGVSAPFTLAGLLTVNNAECLSGLVMTQMLRPGTKVLYANSWTTTDMRTGAALVGSTETSLCHVAGAQLARFYKVPSHTTAPNSDNHAHDEQNAWEKTFSTFTSVASGHDLIVNCGMFATGMTCSHEQLIMDEEISAMSKRIAEGIAVNDDTIAQDLIEEIGPQGEGYLTSDHTMRWLRSKEYLMPRVSVRGPRGVWAAEGSKDTYQQARQKTKEYAKLEAPSFSPERRAQLREIVAQFDTPAAR